MTLDLDRFQRQLEAEQTRLRHALAEILSIEDLLNREVDDILRNHLKEIQRDSVDYRRMFQMVKTKLARERNLVI